MSGPVRVFCGKAEHKMKFNKLAAAGAAFVMLFESVPAGAAYYAGRELKSIQGSELVYEEFSPERLTDAVVRVESLLDSPGNGMEISAAADVCLDEYLRSLEEYRLASLQNDINYNEENAQTVSDAYAASLDAFGLLSGMMTRLGESTEYSYILSDLIGTGDTEDFMASIPPESYYELSGREEELIAEYAEVSGDSDACAKIFTELVEVRMQIAEAFGYGSYADYAHRELYGRDYSAEQTAAFSDAVARSFSGMFEDIFNATMIVRGGTEGMSEEETIARIGEVMGEINGELKSTFDYMLSNGLMNASYSDTKNKVSGAYTVVLPRLRVPYMYINPSRSYEDGPADAARNIIHEFGHFSALLNDPALDTKSIELTGSFSMDTCEVHSQGLESLAESYYGRLFGSGASLERYMRLMKCVGAMLDGCMFNELQTRVYDEGITSVDEINKIMTELLKKYYDLEYTESAAQGLWTSMMHNFEAPMYYLSYAVSGAAALQLLIEAETDMDGAVDKYMKISALGGYVPFREALMTAGFDDVFSEEIIADTAEGVRRAYGIERRDVESGSWYESYALYTSHIMDSADDGGFAPDENITRADFLELIARGYDYYTGIDDGSETGPGKPDGSGDRYISWALGNGISNGYAEGDFGGEDEITREQLVVMMYRLYEYENGDEQTDGYELETFTDAGDVSDWAAEAMEWAVENEIINGREGNMLEPQGTATRAEAAKIEACYIDLVY